MGFATRASSGDYRRYHMSYVWPYDNVAAPPEDLTVYSSTNYNTTKIETRSDRSNNKMPALYTTGATATKFDRMLSANPDSYIFPYDYESNIDNNFLVNDVKIFISGFDHGKYSIQTPSDNLRCVEIENFKNQFHDLFENIGRITNQTAYIKDEIHTTRTHCSVVDVQQLTVYRGSFKDVYSSGIEVIIDERLLNSVGNDFWEEMICYCNGVCNCGGGGGPPYPGAHACGVCAASSTDTVCENMNKDNHYHIDGISDSESIVDCNDCMFCDGDGTWGYSMCDWSDQYDENDALAQVTGCFWHCTSVNCETGMWVEKGNKCTTEANCPKYCEHLGKISCPVYWGTPHVCVNNEYECVVGGPWNNFIGCTDPEAVDYMPAAIEWENQDVDCDSLWSWLGYPGEDEYYQFCVCHYGSQTDTCGCKDMIADNYCRTCTHSCEECPNDETILASGCPCVYGSQTGRNNVGGYIEISSTEDIDLQLGIEISFEDLSESYLPTASCILPLTTPIPSDPNPSIPWYLVLFTDNTSADDGECHIDTSPPFYGIHLPFFLTTSGRITIQDQFNTYTALEYEVTNWPADFGFSRVINNWPSGGGDYIFWNHDTFSMGDETANDWNFICTSNLGHYCYNKPTPGYSNLMRSPDVYNPCGNTGICDSGGDMQNISCNGICGSTDEFSLYGSQTCSCGVNCVGYNNCCYDFFDYCQIGTPSDSKVTIWYEIAGCMDDDYANYQDYATTDNGSCDGDAI